MSSEEEIFKNVLKKSRNKYGLFCLNCLILRHTPKNKIVINNRNIKVSDRSIRPFW